MVEYTKWLIDQDEHSDIRKVILDFLLVEYGMLFGYDIMNAETCIVYNDPSSKCPQMLFDRTPIRLRLSQTDGRCWAQTIFQMSHELCHYAMRQYRVDKNHWVSWYEEIVCEAMSLYALEFSYRKWNQCELSKFAPQFFESIKNYLDDLLEQNEGNEIALCKTVAELMQYDAEKERASHCYQRNTLYCAISQHPDEVHALCKYMDYLNSDGITIDFDKWIKDVPCTLLEICKEINPIKELP